MRKAAHFTVFLTGLMLLSGCGYHKPQAVLAPPTEGQDQTTGKVMMRVKPLRDFECSYYFDNRLISRGIQPLQLYIQNDSDTYYVLSGSDISLPILGKREVGAVFYRNILGRSLVWLLGVALLWQVFLPLFFVDGLFCLQANKEIGSDLNSICINPKEKLVLAPRTRTHKVLFVPVDEYHYHFTITLHEQDTDNVVTFSF